VEPAVLLVGATQSLRQALTVALARHKVYVETSTVDSVVGAVVAAAPDVILLVGDAARDGGLGVLQKLQESPLSSVVPVVILHDDVGLDTRLRAFRHGAAAVIPRSASIDAIADQVAKLAREIPERGSAAVGEVGEATLHEFVQTLSKELRTGILTVAPGSDENEAVRLVLGGGQPIAQLIDEFVQRVRRHMLLAEPLRYEFDERAGGTIQLLDAEGPSSEEPTDIAGLRILLADDDSARADGIAHELRTHGAIVAVTDLEPNDTRFSRLRQIDPSVLLIDEGHLSGQGYGLVRRMRNDTRLRWASMLVVRWSGIWSDSAATPAIPRLAGALSQLGEAERAFIELTNMGDAFDTRLEVMGPGRLLRAAGSCDHVVRLTVHNPRVYVRVDVAEGLVVGATGQTLGSAMKLIEGPAALSALLVLSSGRVRVERVEQAAAANIMGTLDVALNMADAEPSPIAPSLPAPPPSSRPAPAAPELAALNGPNPPIAQELLEIDSLAEARPAAPAPRVALPPPPQVEAARAIPGEAPAVSAPVVAAAAPAFVPPVAPVAAPAAQTALPASPLPAPRRSGLVAFFWGMAVVAALGLAAAGFWFLVREQKAPPVPARRVESPAARAPAPSEAPAPEATVPPATSRPPPAVTDPGLAELPVVERPKKTAPTCESMIGNEKVEASENDSKRHVGAARDELMRGDVEAAQREYCLALQADENNPSALGELARALLLLRGDDQAAEPYARRAVEHATKPNSTLLLGDIMARRGRYDDALAIWLKAMRLTPDDVGKRAARARRDVREAEKYFRRVDYVEAERGFLRAAIIDPRSAEAAAGVARSLLRQRNHQGSLPWAKRARDLAPADAAIRVLLGDALAAAGESSAANAEYREALKLEPHNRDAARRLQAN
jgi:tetratricopeptide (TPR) repeat protein/DNA-binding response OmpR family regulator